MIFPLTALQLKQTERKKPMHIPKPNRNYELSIVGEKNIKDFASLIVNLEKYPHYDFNALIEDVNCKLIQGHNSYEFSKFETREGVPIVYNFYATEVRYL